MNNLIYLCISGFIIFYSKHEDHPSVFHHIFFKIILVCLIYSVIDALLQLASIVDVDSLQTTIKDVLRDSAVVLAGVLQECVFVYLLEAESRLRCEDPPHEVQSEGKLR
uniref:Uncharacterized protein n=1 Tax=Sinocyclocheilus rhinocerous TaxID=307959 RepID=A0A673LJN2_9TELE